MSDYSDLKNTVARLVADFGARSVIEEIAEHVRHVASAARSLDEAAEECVRAARELHRS